MITLKTLPEWAVGPKVLLIGPPGSGKTTAIITALKAGMKVYVIFTEAGQQALMKAMSIYKVTDEEKARLFFTYVKPGSSNFKVLKEQADKVNKAVEFGKMEGGSRTNYNQLVKVMQLCADFVDQHGVSHGGIDTFKADCAVFVDGLSGLSDMAMKLTIGAKPVATLQDWGVAIKQLDDFVKQFSNIDAMVGILAHVAMERDEISGKILQYPSTLGKQLGPQIGRHFNEVIMCSFKEPEGATWATIHTNSDLKATFLPHKAGMKPDFKIVIDAWLASMS
ncbi:MAG: putative DNA helicase [Siphoviridae sp. ct7UA22]|nr:MAG: putative DNA helicase [Siphoviridae sp. ct7UA22]